jgi:VWFA-related protein
MLRRHFLQWVSVFSTTLITTVALISGQAVAQHSGGGSGTGSGSRGGSTPSGGSNNLGNANGAGSTPSSFSNLPTADQEGKLEFHTQTILIQVPVVVTDKGGNHLHGLTKDDFHVFENGKEQKVSTFEEIVTSSAKLSPIAPKPGEFQNLTLSSDQPHSVTVIALDSVNTPFLDQSYGRHELVKYLADSVDSGQVLALMLMTSRGLKVVQGLTGDSAQLTQILKRASGEMPAMQGTSQDAQADGSAEDTSASLFTNMATNDPNAAMHDFITHGDAFYAQFQQQNAIETTLNSFLGIAYALNGIPGRKSLIWATGGFPFTINSPATVPGGYLSTLYERTLQALDEAQVSVYPIDLRGLVVGGMVNASRSGISSPQRMSRRAWYQESKIDTLNEFAEMTGGKAFYNTNDLATSFKRAADDASSYYLVGYYLDTSNEKAGWRTLKVKMDKGGTEVRARQGFFVTNATVHRELTRMTDLGNALTSPLEGTGIPITMKWVGVSGDGDKKKADFVVQLAPGGIALGNAPDNRVDFEFVVTAYAEKAKKGDVPKKFGQTFATSVTEQKMATLRANGIRFGGSLPDIAPGQYAVRLVVRDNVTGKIGSVTAPLTVN